MHFLFQKSVLRAFILLCVLFALPVLNWANPATLEKSILHTSLGSLKLDMDSPDFAGVDLSQKGLEILGKEDLIKAVSDLENGRGVLVFFSTSCIPCRVGLKLITENKESLTKSNTVVWLIGIGDDRATIRKFIEKFNLPYTTIHDPDGKIATRFGVMGKGSSLADAKLPLTIQMDAEGKVYRMISAEGKDYLSLLMESKK